MLLVLGTGLAGGLGLALDGRFASAHRNGLAGEAQQGRLIGLTLLAGAVELVAASNYGREKKQVALLEAEAHRRSPQLRQKSRPRYLAPAASGAE